MRKLRGLPIFLHAEGSFYSPTFGVRKEGAFLSAESISLWLHAQTLNPGPTRTTWLWARASGLCVSQYYEAPR